MSQNIRKKICKSIILEIRPRLQSVNVLINLNESSEHIKLVLEDDNFQLIAETQTAKIFVKNLKILPDTLSSLVITESYISFRFATTSNLDDWGSFKTELLKTLNSPLKTISSNIFLDKTKSYKIQCKNCTQDLSDCVKFDRILPLPSENLEPSDWFCHGHSSSQTSVLDPKEFDVFYTISYCHISKKITRNILESGKLLICKRCLNWLGLLKSSEVVKFWFNTVIYKDESIAHTTIPLEDVFSVLHEILNNVLFNTAKVMLICQSSKKQIDFILLWILEKQLRVQICDSSDEVEDFRVAKVLFRYEKDSTDIVKKWQEDDTVVSVDVSKPMAVEVLKHLYKFNKIFPKVFSESNNFYISYLMMYENKK